MQLECIAPGDHQTKQTNEGPIVAVKPRKRPQAVKNRGISGPAKSINTLQICSLDNNLLKNLNFVKMEFMV